MNKSTEVYEFLKIVPKGKVVTYGIIAQVTGISNPRHVGRYLHNNPDPANIPCHRVVNASGRLAPAFAFGGVAAQAERLEAEGVEVVCGKVNLSIYLWDLK